MDWKAQVAGVSDSAWTLLLHRAGDGYEGGVPSMPLLHMVGSLHASNRQQGTREFLYTGVYKTPYLFEYGERPEGNGLGTMLLGGSVILAPANTVEDVVTAGFKSFRKIPRWLDTIVVDWACEASAFDEVSPVDWAEYTSLLSAAARKGVRIVMSVRVPSNFWSLSTLPRVVQEWAFLADHIATLRGIESDPFGEPDIFVQKEGRLSVR